MTTVSYVYDKSVLRLCNSVLPFVVTVSYVYDNDVLPFMVTVSYRHQIQAVTYLIV